MNTSGNQCKVQRKPPPPLSSYDILKRKPCTEESKSLQRGESKKSQKTAITKKEAQSEDTLEIHPQLKKLLTKKFVTPSLILNEAQLEKAHKKMIQKQCLMTQQPDYDENFWKYAEEQFAMAKELQALDLAQHPSLSFQALLRDVEIQRKFIRKIEAEIGKKIKSGEFKFRSTGILPHIAYDSRLEELLARLEDPSSDRDAVLAELAKETENLGGYELLAKFTVNL